MFNITYDIISDSPKIINIFYEKFSVSCLEDELTSRAIRALLNVLVTTRPVKQLSIGPFITVLLQSKTKIFKETHIDPNKHIICIFV